MYYQDTGGRQILDAAAGLWCVNAGHGREEIARAVSDQLLTLDYSPAFQMGNPVTMEAAERLARLLPDGLDTVFFTNSGSEAVETALKIARTYHVARGEPHRTRLIGRNRGYHGVNFGGLSVGGIARNKQGFGPLLAEVDHLVDTHDLQRNQFCKGLPEHGAERADDLLRLIKLYGAETIAAVIVEPVAGSTGVLVPPQDYLDRLRAICSAHGILLIFDEVITAFGRLGAPFAAQRFGVTPDLITMAKGLTNGVIPMGAVGMVGSIRDTIFAAAPDGIELFHGYTYSGHPVAAAAAIATLDIYEREDLFARAAGLASRWTDALLTLRNEPHVIDIRTDGLVGGIEVAPGDGGPGKRGFSIFQACYARGVLTRVTGDIIALSPPLIVTEDQIDQIVETIVTVLRAAA
ncbi:aminotransferase class III-fold pyridoxal phosphate-dependent enzyme [Sphingopyxis fribergensis]